ncbi:hypothetical protein XOC_0248 [Xanthomonas oryzae pv. oryzicola BLS256]|uniref:Uncharacterized protein n=1 Tax=Xanthomonas oryzae pv. oryzicola (strain BLS256) TaxID=383407 RepID=G7TJT5_XANOB|nr:hypothetical protein XOC_0248 [Xanthomonas oryzae pv. oryzicola BLS256]
MAALVGQRAGKRQDSKVRYVQMVARRAVSRGWRHCDMTRVRWLPE